MLPSIQRAFFVNGPRRKVIAARCASTERTIRRWMTGDVRCPTHKRQSFDRAMSAHDAPASVDWSAYDTECDALKSPETPEKRPLEVHSDFSAPRTPKQPNDAPAPPTSEPEDDLFAMLYGV
ncbi:TPA_inf: hypothetical protein gp_13 [Marinomonas phage YY]|nr:TPA_inf: hypothetical protein gp_13 [Marinomonas phage YY]